MLSLMKYSKKDENVDGIGGLLFPTAVLALFSENKYSQSELSLF